MFKRRYETLLLLSPELNAEERKAILATATQIIEREGGAMVKVDEWGMRDLAYPVRKQMRGYYILLEYDAVGQTVAELERILRIQDGLYKFMSVLLDADPDADQAEAEAPAEEAVEEAVEETVKEEEKADEPAEAEAAPEAEAAADEEEVS